MPQAMRSSVYKRAIVSRCNKASRTRETRAYPHLIESKSSCKSLYYYYLAVHLLLGSGDGLDDVAELGLE